MILEKDHLIWWEQEHPKILKICYQHECYSMTKLQAYVFFTHIKRFVFRTISIYFCVEKPTNAQTPFPFTADPPMLVKSVKVCSNEQPVWYCKRWFCFLWVNFEFWTDWWLLAGTKAKWTVYVCRAPQSQRQRKLLFAIKYCLRVIILILCWFKITFLFCISLRN